MLGLSIQYCVPAQLYVWRGTEPNAPHPFLPPEFRRGILNQEDQKDRDEALRVETTFAVSVMAMI